MGVKKAGRRVACLGKVAWRKTSRLSFFATKVEREQAFNRKSALRECLLSIWRSDINQAVLAPSEVSCLSWESVDDRRQAAWLRGCVFRRQMSLSEINNTT